MKQKIIIGGLLLGALAVMIVMGISTFQTINAAASTSAQTGDTTTETTTDKVGKDGRLGEVTDEYLAEALGITTDELTAARQAAWEAGLAEAVKQDLITQTQADELLAGDRMPRIAGRTSQWLTEHGIDFDSLLADQLGISVEKLEAAYVSARTARIDQAVADGNLTEEQASLLKGSYALFNNQNFQDSMQSAYEAAIQQAVKDGVITQDQADLILEKGSLFDFDGKPGLHLPGLFDGMRGGHRPHGGGRFFPGAPAESTEQTETP